MPKKLFKVSNFHSGIDETSSPVDMKEGFFPALQGVLVDRMGQVVPMGDFETPPTDNPTDTAFRVVSDPGYGLFSWVAGRKYDGTLGTTSWYIIQTDAGSTPLTGSQFIVWDNGGVGSVPDDTWNNIIEIDVSLLSSEFMVKPDFIAFDEVLRICDA